MEQKILDLKMGEFLSSYTKSTIIGEKSWTIKWFTQNRGRSNVW